MCLVCVLSLVWVLVCFALSAFWWVLFSVRCFAPGVFFCSAVSPVRCSWRVVLVARASVLLVLFGGSWFGCVAPPLFAGSLILLLFGSPPLLTQNATWLGWLCGVSAPAGLWESVSVCGHVVHVVLEFVYSVWCVSGSAFYSLQLSVWSSFLPCCCFGSLFCSVCWVVLRFSLDPPGSCCFCLCVSSCCVCCCCCVSCYLLHLVVGLWVKCCSGFFPLLGFILFIFARFCTVSRVFPLTIS